MANVLQEVVATLPDAHQQPLMPEAARLPRFSERTVPIAPPSAVTAPMHATARPTPSPDVLRDALTVPDPRPRRRWRQLALPIGAACGGAAFVAVLALALRPSRPIVVTAAESHVQPVSAAAPRDAAVTDAAPTGAELQTTVADVALVEPVAYVSTALALARRLAGDAQLLALRCRGVAAPGLAFADGHGGCTYRFWSASSARAPHPPHEPPRCEVEVAVSGAGAVTGARRPARSGFDCEDLHPVRAPRCTLRQVWQKARARGATWASAVDDAALEYDGTGWIFSGTKAGTYVTYRLADDCT